MKLNKGYALVLWLLVAMLFVATAVAQETTAGLQGVIKDPQGAVISKAVVEVSGPALIGVKKAETDASGYYRFANLPPGQYTLLVTAQGFRTLKQAGINLEVGKLGTLDIKLSVGGIEQTIEVSSEAPIVDTTQSKVQTNVTAETLNGIPKGRSFQSVIQFAPGARYEPLQSTGGYSGYQIDGASNAENSFLVEGQETKDVNSGQTKTNTPFEFIQEVQVKSAGFEAEYGGALGGVINVIQKRGSNAWHGSIFTYYQGDVFNAAPSRYERYDPDGNGYNCWDATNPEEPNTDCAPANGLPRSDAFTQFYQPKKDHYRIVEPGFEAGGYLKKDTLWLFASTVPRYASYRRTVNFGGTTGNRSFNEDLQTYYSLARADARITNKIRVYGAWQYAYQRGSGTNLPNADDAFGLYNTSSGSSPDNFQHGIGYVAPNLIWNIGADVTITPNLVATTRFGKFYNDYQDRGLPVGMRYRWLSSNYTGGTYQARGSTAATAALDGTTLGNVFPAGVHSAGYSSIGANYQSIFNQYGRRGFSQDLAWFKKGMLGTHNIKGGYQQNQLSNNHNEGYATAQAYIAYGVQYQTLPSNTACTQIVAQNIANGWAAGGNATQCQGLWGTYNVREYGVVGNVASFNHALYVQDAWTLGKGVTLNLGVRFDKEDVPSYDPKFPGVTFGFADKFAPRFGGAWDVMQNGKFKVYGSFGYFYDIMNLNLPLGSFGGAYWHDCVYTLDDPDYTKIKPQRSPVHFCNPTGGANGTLTGRFIENKDFRIYSNDPANYRIDPNLKPMKQHEMILGSEWAINPKLAFEARYSRKRLDRTIEDAGLVTGAGEIFYIINPGEGIHLQPLGPSECVGCPTQPKAIRDFDGLEFRLVRREAANWFGTVSYTYSKLRGNYSGLTNTDVADGGSGGRSDPNNNRSFDEPFMQFDSHGRPIDGPLATDRPHEIKAFGYYKLKWFSQETLIGMTQQAFSGTPLSTYIDVQSGGTPVYVEGRGKWVPATQSGSRGDWVFGTPTEKRTPFFSQTDLNLVHTFHISKTDEARTLAFTMNVTNLFNQRSAVSYDQQIDSAYDGGFLNSVNAANIPVGSNSGFDYKTYMTGYNWKSLVNNQVSIVDGVAQPLILSSGYGQPNLFQDGRSFRFQVKYTF